MSDPLLVLPLLLVPVLALLFLNLRLSRRIRYPHELLTAEGRRGAASLLFRSLRSHYDVLVDAAIAVALAFAIAAPTLRSSAAAVVIDCSRTMLAGISGQRPLDLAIGRLASEPQLKEAQPFALVFDAAKGRTVLVPIGGLIRRVRAGGSANTGAGAAAKTDAVENIARQLQTSFDFFAPDYGELATLRSRGYGAITLVTDHLRFHPDGFRVEETGTSAHIAAYPTSVRYDRTAESWLVVLAESGPRLPLLISVWDREAAAFRALETKRYAISEAAGGRRIRFAEPGLYLVSIRAPGGEVDVDLPISLHPRATRAAAVGPFSERVLSVFPLLEKSPRPELVLADRGTRTPAGPRTIRTALNAAEGENLLDPGLTEGALVPSGYAADADFALGPSSLADPDLVIAYDSAIRMSDTGFSLSIPPGASPLVRVGGSYVARVDGALVPIIAPPERYFELPAEGTIALPPPSRGRLGWALILAALAAGKLALWRRFSGKKLFRTY